MYPLCKRFFVQFYSLVKKYLRAILGTRAILSPRDILYVRAIYTADPKIVSFFFNKLFIYFLLVFLIFIFTITVNPIPYPQSVTILLIIFFPFIFFFCTFLLSCKNKTHAKLTSGAKSSSWSFVPS